MEKILLSICVFVCVAAFSGTAYAQERTIEGTVTDHLGDPLPGTTVFIKEQPNKGTSTNPDGNYSIEVEEGDILIFSFVGFISKEVEVTDQLTIDVQLQMDTGQLEEIVVVGYSSKKKVDLTGAIETVEMEPITTGTSGNIMQTLQGRVPGLYVEKSGTPSGASSRILIRGVNTLGNNDPLYIIDGVPTKRPEVFQSLSPSTIESIQVLKDAASASVYGSRASNGVIIVTTKDGSRAGGGLDIQLNVSNSVQSERPQRFDMLNAQQRGEALWRASVNDGVSPASGYGEIYTFDWNNDFNNPVLNGVSVNPFVGGNTNVPAGDTDWQEESYDLGQVRNLDFTVSGGNESSSALISVGYVKNTGMLKYTNYDRISARVNAQTRKFDGRLEIGMNSIFSNSNELLQSPDLGSAPTPGLAITLAPTIPVFTNNGEYAGPLGSGYSDRNNPVHMQYINRWDNTNRKNVVGDVYAQIELIPELRLKSTVGVDYSTYRFKNIEQAFTEGFISRSLNTLGLFTNEFMSISWSNTVNYQITTGNNSFQFLAGIEAIQDNFDELIATAENFATQSEEFFVLSAASGTKQSLGTSTSSRLLSQFGKVDYNYDDRYLASLTLRRDGSSRFGDDNRYGFFPSATFGWRINNESFMEEMDEISNLKLRIAAGRVGNQDIGDFASLGLFEARYGPTAANIPGVGSNGFFDQYYNIGTAYDLNGSDSGSLPSGFVSTQGANPALKWENTDELNIGIDFGLLEERVVGSFDYFFRETSDILIRPPVASAVGEGQLRFLNGATKENKGWELSLGYDGGRDKDFTYYVSTSLSRFKDKITKLPEEVRTAFPGNAIKDILGQSELSVFGYRTDGLFQNQAEVDDHASQVGAAPGRIKYVDLNGDGQIDALDQEFIGTTLPGLEYNLNIQLGYKNFDARIFGSGIAGRTGFDPYTFYNNFIRGRDNVGPGVFDAWTPENTDTSIPALTLADSNNETRPSDYLLVNTSYFKIRNVEIGYTLPEDVMSRLGGINRFRVFLKGENLIWFKSSEFNGPDPERVDINQIPVPTTFTVGASISL